MRFPNRPFQWAMRMPDFCTGFSLPHWNERVPCRAGDRAAKMTLGKHFRVSRRAARQRRNIFIHGADPIEETAEDGVAQGVASLVSRNPRCKGCGRDGEKREIADIESTEKTGGAEHGSSRRLERPSEPIPADAAPGGKSERRGNKEQQHAKRKHQVIEGQYPAEQTDHAFEKPVPRDRRNQRKQQDSENN